MQENRIHCHDTISMRAYQNNSIDHIHTQHAPYVDHSKLANTQTIRATIEGNARGKKEMTMMATEATK